MKHEDAIFIVAGCASPRLRVAPPSYSLAATTWLRPVDVGPGSKILDGDTDERPPITITITITLARTIYAYLAFFHADLRSSGLHRRDVDPIRDSKLELDSDVVVSGTGVLNFTYDHARCVRPGRAPQGPT